MAAVDQALILWPNWADVGVRLTPTLAGGSWRASLPLSNLQKRDLATVARSTDTSAASTRFRVDLKEDKQVRGIALIYRSPERVGAPSTAARIRILGISTSGQGVLFDYESGDDVTALGGTFARASIANQMDTVGALTPVLSGVLRDSHFIGGFRHTLIEPAATNVVLRKRDLSNAAWTKTNMTAARDQVGIEGGSNTASSLLATAGNATALQAITLASSARLQSAYVKRLVGSGTVQMTTDNGATWTAVTVTAAWTRVTIPSQTLANPTVGFRIVTSGDKIAVDWVQNETGAVATSPIGTMTDNTATETRAADVLTFPLTAAPQASTWYAKFTEQGTISTGTTSGLFGIGNSTNAALFVFNSGGQYTVTHRRASDVTSAMGSAPSNGQVVELRATLAANGAVQIGQSINGAAEVTGTASGTNALATAWSDTTLTIGGRDTSGAANGVTAFRSVRIASGVKTLTEMQALVYDSGYFTPFPAGKTTDDTEGLNLIALQLPASTLAMMRYMYVDIDDRNNAAGYIDLNRLIVAGAVEAAHNFSVGAAIGLETGTTAEDSDGSVTTYVRRATRRSVTCLFEEQDDTSADGIFDFQRVAGIDRQFLFVWDRSDSARWWRRAFLATMRQLSKFEANVGNRWGIPHEIREVL